MPALLAERRVIGTFFVQGRWAAAYPDTARRLAAEGHLIGSHSHYHTRLPLLTDEGISSDVEDAEAAIQEVIGVDPRPWFRCPFGAGAEDPRVLGQLAASGYRDIGWDVDPTDWEPGRQVAEVISTVVEGTLARGDGRSC